MSHNGNCQTCGRPWMQKDCVMTHTKDGCVCLDLKKPMQCRGGTPVRILCTDGPDLYYPIVGYVGNTRQTIGWQINGCRGNGPNYYMDLVNIPEKPTQYDAWINLYKHGVCGPIIGTHKDKQRADMDRTKESFAQVHLRYYSDGKVEIIND